MGAAMRVPSYAVWDTMVFLLNVLAFLLVGLQIGPILERLDAAQRSHYLVISGTVLATVILARIVWVMGYNTVTRLKNRWFGVHLPRPMLAPSLGTGLVISWAGMRGIVTLAAALALPDSFPYRDLIVLTAFIVVFGTLVIQGTTLRPLLLALKLHDDEPVEREVRLARVETARAGLAALDGDDSAAAQELKRELTIICDGARDAQDGDGRTVSPQRDLRRRILEAGRQRLWELREDATIGDDAYHRLEAELDLTELDTAE
jgi:CPA1 family monovalent cation:H+ antiporter